MTIYQSGQKYTDSGWAIPPPWFIVTLVLGVLFAVVVGVLATLFIHDSPAYNRTNIKGVECVTYHGEPTSCNWGAR